MGVERFVSEFEFEFEFKFFCFDFFVFGLVNGDLWSWQTGRVLRT